MLSQGGSIMTPTMTPAVAMLFEVGTKLAPLEGVGAAVAMIVAIAIFVAAAYEMGARRFELLFRLDLPPRPRSDVRNADDRLDQAA